MGKGEGRRGTGKREGVGDTFHSMPALRPRTMPMLSSFTNETLLPEAPCAENCLTAAIAVWPDIELVQRSVLCAHRLQARRLDQG